MDTIRIPVSGDPFYAAAHHRDEAPDRPCCCLEGWVFVGYIDDSEAGEEREASYRCRCSKACARS
jgi:hypothetical protein